MGDPFLRDDVKHTSENERRLVETFLRAAEDLARVFNTAEAASALEPWMTEALSALSTVYRAALQLRLLERNPKGDEPDSDKVVAAASNEQRLKDEAFVAERLGARDPYSFAPFPTEATEGNDPVVGRLSEDLAEVNYYVQALRRAAKSLKLSDSGLHAALLMTPFGLIWGKAAARAIHILHEQLGRVIG